MRHGFMIKRIIYSQILNMTKHYLNAVLFKHESEIAAW